MSEDRGFRVSSVRVNQHAWNDTVPVEGLSVCEVGVGLSCVGRGVVPGRLSGVEGLIWRESDVPSSDRQVSFGEVFEVSWFGAKWRYISCVIFPEELSLVERPLGRVPALDIGILGVRHNDIEGN